MTFMVEAAARNFKICPAGNHLARLYRIIDLGTQKTQFADGMRDQRKVMFGWEVHSESEDGEPTTTDDGAPMAIFKNYTLSWNEAATLRKDLQAWRGKPWTDQEARAFDIRKVLGQWCLLNVVHKPGKMGDKMFANVAGIAPVPGFLKQQGIPAGYNELQCFQLGSPDWAMFETFGQGLKAKIQASPEYISWQNQPKATPKAAPKDDDSETPF